MITISHFTIKQSSPQEYRLFSRGIKRGESIFFDKESNTQGVKEGRQPPLVVSFPLSLKKGCIISAVFNSFCHSRASGNPEIVPQYINVDPDENQDDDF